MTTFENVTDWRQLSDQLTAYQRNELELFEAEMSRWKPSPEALVRMARSMVSENLVQIRFADVPAPADAIDTPGEWQEMGGDRYQRTYVCWDRYEAGAVVQIVGFQRTDETITRSIYVSGVDEELTSDQGRTISVMLAEAAEALDRLDGDAPPFM